MNSTGAVHSPKSSYKNAASPLSCLSTEHQTAPGQGGVKHCIVFAGRVSPMLCFCSNPYKPIHLLIPYSYLVHVNPQAVKLHLAMHACQLLLPPRPGAAPVKEVREVCGTRPLQTTSGTATGFTYHRTLSQQAKQQTVFSIKRQQTTAAACSRSNDRWQLCR